MNIEDLLLRKEEITILYDNCFMVPIYPILLSDEVKIDPQIPHLLFKQAADEWYRELKEYSALLQDKETKEWYDNVFLKEPPEIKEERGRQIIGPQGFWEDGVQNLKNGFVDVLSINRNAGGSLFVGEAKPQYISPPFVNFSKNKFEEYKAPLLMDYEGLEGVYSYIFSSHNIDHYPGALFLRDWAILCANESLKQVLK